jgi:hypothetical protein
LDKNGVTEKFPYENQFISDAIFPRIFKDANQGWISPQKEIIAFYGLRNIARGCLISSRFIEGGNLLDESGFYALSVAAYYSAVFQVLITFLALNGKVIITSPVDRQLNIQDVPKQLVAKLSRDNEWTLHGASRDHKAIWGFLSEVFNENYKNGIPGFFTEFLMYIAKLNQFTLDLTDKKEVECVVKSIPSLRHQALYAGFGFDRTKFERAIKEQVEYNSQIDTLSKMLKAFAVNLLSYCLEETLILKGKIEMLEGFASLRFILRNSIWFPPFEATKDLNLGESDIEAKIKILQKWLSV